MNITLVCSLGGSPQPVSVSLSTLRPNRVAFVASARSVEQIDAILVAQDFKPSSEVILLKDEQNLVQCLSTLKGAIAKHADWENAAMQDKLYVDFTGGTKVMVAAMVMAFVSLPVIFRYVGGSVRTKDGLGIVQNGTENIIFCQKNPLILRD